MSARARWRSESCAPLALSAVESEPPQDQAMGEHNTQVPRKEREKGRASPDPMHATDRYRLVTPFTLHL